MTETVSTERLELIERLLEGVPRSGMHDDNETELFDIEEANDTMAEAAAALRAAPRPKVEPGVKHSADCGCGYCT